MNPNYAIPAVALVVVATVLVGAFGLRISRTTSDFLVASRPVGPQWNAAAISGESLSAASFLGVAGLIAKYGAGMKAEADATTPKTETPKPNDPGKQ